MTSLANWTSPELLRTLGWTLLHFVWQGAALAAVFAVAMALCRSASARYAVAAGTLVLMMASPVVTFSWILRQTNPAVRKTLLSHSRAPQPLNQERNNRERCCGWWKGGFWAS